MALKIKRPTKNFDRPLTQNFTDYQTQFLSFMGEHGMEPCKKTGLVTDGSIGRAFINLGGDRKLSGWYQLWLNQSVPFGRVGDYRISTDQPTATWLPENKKSYRMTKAHKEEIVRLQKEAEIKKAEKYSKAAKKAQTLWEQATPCEKHPYLEKKGVLSYGLREDKKGNLMIPLYDTNLSIVGLQYINNEGKKLFLTGSRKSGSFFILGQEVLKSSDTIYYAEGYATGASVHQDMSMPVFIAFDAYNLEKVTKAVFEKLKDRKHVFIADNDDSKTGEKEAIKAKQWIIKNKGMAEVHMPETKGDYNDHAGTELPTLKIIDTPTEYNFTKSDKGRMLNIKENVLGVMKTHSIEVNYNVIKKKMEIDVPNMNFIADMKDEASLVEVEDRCIKMGVPYTRVRDYLKVLADEYNPVAEWIDSKPWDGSPRLPDFLNTIVPSSPTALKDMLLKKWLISCVAAVYEPNGVELEGILVFQGAQGLGKTLWFKRLCNYNNGWLLEGATLNPSDKDSVKRAVSHWIVELGEIESTFKKSDIDQLKAFVTAKTDELRLPYDRAFTTYQRRTAFFASVNAREFLTDSSGNRRFWCISVNEINYNHGINMQQLWAEVKETLYVQGQKNWFLSPDERELLQDSNEGYRTQSSVEDLILQYVDFNGKYTEPVQMTSLLRDLGIANPRMPDFKDAARVLAERGVEPRRTNGKKVYDLDYTKSGDSSLNGNFRKDY